MTSLVFACFATTRVTMQFRAKNARYCTGLSSHIGDPVVRTDGRTDGDGRSRDYYVTSKISWLDRLPILLSNGAPLARGLRYKNVVIYYFVFVSDSVI